MVCPKCTNMNVTNAKFCSACGEVLQNHVVEQKIPAWKWLLLVFLCAGIGALGYLFLDYYNEQQTTTNHIDAISVANDHEQLEESIPQNVPASTVTENGATKEPQPLDRVSLIKDVQQKVFTVLTTYGHGSGFLYAKGGYVVTNAHVVDGEVDVAVRNAQGQEFPAEVIGISENYDIALLHVSQYQNEAPLDFEKSESQVGLDIIAFGSPQGFENTASSGFITGQGRDMDLDRFRYEQIYQVDAQIDKGSSGGPLVDATTGKVIGINSLVYTSETSTNFSFSIPLYSMAEYFDAWINQPMSRENVLAVAGIYEQYNQDQNKITDDVDAILAGQFVQSFRMYYEMALNQSDFSWIADMLEQNSIAYQELEDYVADMSWQGHEFVFISNDILDVTSENDYFYVYMNETFDFYNASGDYEYYDRYKTYVVTVDYDGSFKIRQIDIHS